MFIKIFKKIWQVSMVIIFSFFFLAGGLFLYAQAGNEQGPGGVWPMYTEIFSRMFFGQPNHSAEEVKTEAINSSNIFRLRGNVGIGTLTPTEKLQVEGGNLTVGGNINATNKINASNNINSQTKLCIKGNCIDEWTDVITLYNAASMTYGCDKCYDTYWIGRHTYCALSRVSGPGGLNTQCYVYKSNNDWYLNVQDDDDNDEDLNCTAECFDLQITYSSP